MSPKKKPSVSPELSRDWLRRYEEFGDSYRKIGLEDGYDQRTVKANIVKMQEERDKNQARVAFFRDNLQKHHQDLCDRAEEIVDTITAEKPVNMDYKEDLYLNSLRQHLNRSILWNRIKDWNDTLEKIDPMREKAHKKIDSEIRKSKFSTDFFEAMSKVSVHQFDQWTRGNQGLNISDDWHIEERREDGVISCYGFSHFKLINESDLPILKTEVRNFEEMIKKWPEYSEMTGVMNKMKKLKQELRTDLRGMIIRRVIPGKCSYCPV